MMQFPIYGVNQEFLGHGQGGPADCGDCIWPQARQVAAAKYGVEASRIERVGVRLRDGTVLDFARSSDLTLPELRRVDTP